MPSMPSMPARQGVLAGLSLLAVVRGLALPANSGGVSRRGFLHRSSLVAAPVVVAAPPSFAASGIAASGIAASGIAAGTTPAPALDASPNPTANPTTNPSAASLVPPPLLCMCVAAHETDDFDHWLSGVYLSRGEFSTRGRADLMAPCVRCIVARGGDAFFGAKATDGAPDGGKGQGRGRSAAETVVVVTFFPESALESVREFYSEELNRELWGAGRAAGWLRGGLHAHFVEPTLVRYPASTGQTTCAVGAAGGGGSRFYASSGKTATALAPGPKGGRERRGMAVGAVLPIFTNAG
eukprot:CAMPEP_0172622510 /NCGR_PEP_ID=MMETSP1068-20121228/120994_1 /TAXON_ID=35684 /ORGANISM="Pseudopedinella elastica, Strain CCMP716" /LENGTH=295 /DNA_ID=CAMNT_0013430695 /DNA_START=127 /DNA_END=1010 /DNA_ORIENTATION=-